jgi:hypothetical protein
MKRPAVFGVLAVLVLLTGCASIAANPPGSPSPTGASSTSPTPSETSAPQTQTPEAEDGFDEETLIQLCVERTAGDFGTPLQPDLARATVEHYDSDYPWFVLVPGLSGDVESLAYCTIGGTEASPTFELRGAADASMEDEIRSWVS